MTGDTTWVIPPSTRDWLGRVPEDVGVALLLRHSVRPHLPPGREGHAIPVTETGVRLARELGGQLGSRLRSLHSSPLKRCIQTAGCLREGAGQDLDVEPDTLLGDPGAFVLDGDLAWPSWQKLGHEGVMAHLVSESEPLPGMAAPDQAARFLVHHMLTIASAEPGLHVFVTHDSLVTATAARMLGVPLGQEYWPWYLESAFFWRDHHGTHSAYRQRHEVRDGPLCGFDERDLIEFARREVASTIGLQSPARVFLTGGAFKTLLSGHPPRDLDLWAPTPSDRDLLVQSLQSRGAEPLERGTFADVFSVGGRVVEVPDKAEPDVLELRLQRADIAMAAVGVEYRPGGHWRAVVDPLALLSIGQRQVLLLRKPLRNWKYALATLERMRRYADELGFEIPPTEEREVWKVFEAQTPEMQRGMLERFDRTAFGGRGVREEARCHLR